MPASTASSWMSATTLTTPAGGRFPELSRFPIRRRWRTDAQSLFGVRYQDALWEQFKARKRQTYGLVRSSGALAAPYPFVLYSDLYDHRQFIRALVNSSFSGLLWCPEVRDARERGRPDPPAAGRDVLSAGDGQRVVHHQSAMEADRPQEEQCKRAVSRLAHDWKRAAARSSAGACSLMPYLRAAFAKYAADGTPPFRAMALDWPDQPPNWHAGSMTRGWWATACSLRRCSPANRAGRYTCRTGTWHNFWTGEERSPADASSQVPATERHIPVFVRGGECVLPLAEDHQLSTAEDAGAHPARSHLRHRRHTRLNCVRAGRVI